MRPLRFTDLGRRPYGPTLTYQQRLAEAVRDAGHDEVFLSVEHEPVITIGRRGSRAHVLASEEQLEQLGVDLFEVERGGEVTYHGLGQLVLYPIVRVVPTKFGVRDLVDALAAAIIDELQDLGIDASFDRANPGLWVGDAKIGAVGMRVQRGVSTHGSALNVSVDAEAIRLIVPCGMENVTTTNVVELCGQAPPLAVLARRIAENFSQRLDFVMIQSEERVHI